jgi:hypothetical protein
LQAFEHQIAANPGEDAFAACAGALETRVAAAAQDQRVAGVQRRGRPDGFGPIGLALAAGDAGLKREAVFRSRRK